MPGLTVATPLYACVGALAGAALGPLLRGRIFQHSVAADQPRRTDCRHCGHTLATPGRPGLAAALPVTGRCPICRCRIGPPAGTVEASAAAVLALLAWRVGQPLPLLALAWVFLIAVALCFIDIAVHRLPDRLTLPAAGGGLAAFGTTAMVTNEYRRIAVAVACAAGVAGLYLLLALITPTGMGLGDSKAGLSTGLVTGWYGWPAAAAGTIAGFLLAGLVAATLLLSGRAEPKDALPHGPFMLLAALATVVLVGG